VKCHDKMRDVPRWCIFLICDTHHRQVDTIFIQYHIRGYVFALLHLLMLVEDSAKTGSGTNCVHV
jgi:hypothetical protein